MLASGGTLVIYRGALVVASSGRTSGGTSRRTVVVVSGRTSNGTSGRTMGNISSGTPVPANRRKIVVTSGILVVLQWW